MLLCMQLTNKHIEFCREFMASNSATDAYSKAFKNKNRRSCSVAASYLLTKRPEIKELIEKMRRDKEQQLIAFKEKELQDLKQQVLSEIELDFFHSQVLRGQMLVEEVYQVREYVPVQKDQLGQLVPGTGRWAVTFKKVTRPPNIREKQISADMLYRRKGSYAPLKIRPIGIEDGDGEESENEERVLILSNGERIPFPGIK